MDGGAGVKHMQKNRLKITPEMLRMLDAIRENCNKIDHCIDCPLHTADDPYNICRLAIGMYPLSWDFTGLEVESDG